MSDGAAQSAAADAPEAERSEERGGGSGGGKLSLREWRFLAALGLPAFGLTLAVTMISTYMPVRLHGYVGTIATGVLIGIEGVFGLFVPALVGPLSDRSGATVRDRLNIVWVAAGTGAAAVFVAGLVHALWAIVLALSLFYIAYFSYLAPYWALYPDLVKSRVSGRSRGAESAMRELGTATALIGGGVMLTVWFGLPFLLAGISLLIVTVGLRWAVREHLDDDIGAAEDEEHEHHGGRGGRFGNELRSLRALATQPGPVRELVVATALWNAALAAIKAFVVLFFTVGLGRSSSLVSLVFLVVSLPLLVAAPVSGKLADTLGHVRVLRVAVIVYGGGLLVPFFFQDTWVLGAVPFVAAAAGTVMTLPFAVLMRVMPEAHHGTASGLFGVARGAGTLLGPVLAGVAIQLTQPLLSGTKGYQSLWAVAGGCVLLSLIFLGRLREAADERGGAGI